MSISNEHYPAPSAIGFRLRSRDWQSRRPQTARWDGMSPVMGPANRAPGVSIMGSAIPDLDAGVMGGPDQGPRVSVMGRADRAARPDVFGVSDLRFVDSLFVGPGDDH